MGEIDETIEREALPNSGARRRRWGVLVSLCIVFVVAGISLIAFFGWTELYSSKFEPNPPEIVPIEIPRGIGLAPVTVKVDLRDPGAGLDEVVVRAKQRGKSREILRQELSGKKSARVAIDFPGEKSDLEEGVVELEIKAFDRSFWSNASTRNFSFKVDFRKPRLEVLTTQHNARKGGSQLIIYRAIDEDPAISGVQVGDRLFQGFPARGLDKDFQDPSLFAAIFALDMRGEDHPPLHLYAEDAVGNNATTTFYYHIQERSSHSATVKVGEDFLRQTVAGIIEQNLPLFEQEASAHGKSFAFATTRGSAERLYEQFALANSMLRSLNDQQIAKLLAGPRFERMWETPLSKPTGTTLTAFGDNIKYLFEDRDLGSTLATGYEVGAPRGVTDVFAAADGVVTFSDGFGVYGRTLAVDHGLGLSTVYGGLEQALVNKGETVRRGQRIARLGSTGLARGPRLYFEVRVHGIPVAPEEWWEDRWFSDHITDKINEVKQALGLAVLRPIGQ